MIFFFCCFSVSALVNAQQQLDSLKKALEQSDRDTHRLNILSNLVELSPEGEWQRYNEQFGKEIEELEKEFDPRTLRTVLRNKAVYINNEGYRLYQLGNIPSAIDAYHRCLSIQEQLGNTTAVALSLNNIGYVHSQQGDTEMALEYYEKSLQKYREAEDEEGIALCMNNIGSMNDRMAKELIASGKNYEEFAPRMEKAMQLYKKSFEMHEKIGDRSGMAYCLNNIGALYGSLITQWQKHGLNKDSVAYYRNKQQAAYTECLSMMLANGDEFGMVSVKNNIGQYYFDTGNYIEARKWVGEALLAAENAGYQSSISNSARLLYQINKQSGNYAEALLMHEKFIAKRDSVQSESNRKAALQTQFRYQYEKKAASDSIRSVEEKKVISLKLEKEETKKTALYVGLFIVLIFALFIYNRFRITQKQKLIIQQQQQETEEKNRIIEQQNELVLEKQKEIIDSITYAKRLQQAILPSQESMNQLLPRHFVLYQPKDIVAGDFYWMQHLSPKSNAAQKSDASKTEEDLILIAAADSTGHGVPGSLVSIVCSNALDKATKEHHLTNPGDVLDKTRELVLETFSKSGEEIKDGMDISLLLIDRRNKQIRWSGANNPLWYLEAGQNLMQEIKADKQPIGKSDVFKSFSTHSIEWKEGTIFYLFTDGFADQFGGPSGKKYKYKPFSETLIRLSALPLDQQKMALWQEFEKWRGQAEQVDDVCVLALQL